MRIIQTSNYREMSQTAALLILNHLVSSNHLILGLATGFTPSGLYQDLINASQKLQLDLDEVQFFHLDEYLGFAPQNPESMASFLHEKLLSPLNILPENCHFVPATRADVQQACLDYEAQIQACGGIDLQILGIGKNGHIAFNEPGTSFHLNTHICHLSESTRRANARYFSQGQTPKQAMTLGLKSILDAKQVMLLASGREKAQAIHDMLYGPISEDCPASALRFHSNLTIILDRDAAVLCDLPQPKFKAQDLEVFNKDKSMDQFRQVLVAAPHPDDASIGCGGLLNRLRRNGAQLHFVAMTSGHRAQIPNSTQAERTALRIDEAQKEADVFGGSFACLDLPFYENGYIPGSSDIQITLKHLLKVQPDLILSTSPEDLHPAHRYSALIIQEALKEYVQIRKVKPELWYYEGPWFLFAREAFNTVIELSDEDLLKKTQGIQAHQSQISRKRYDLAAASLARFRAITVPESKLSKFGAGLQDVGTEIELFQRVVWTG